MNKRLLTAMMAALLAAGILASPAGAHDWGDWRKEHPLPKAPTPTDLNGLQLKVWQDYIDELRAARLERWKGWVEHKQWHAKQVPPDPRPPTPGYSGSVPDLIRSIFPSSQWAPALCTADHESGFNPSAHNSSGASGVFQFMPSVWPGFSSSAGYGGSSVFNAVANVATAAWVVANYGWYPWSNYAHSYWCPGW